VAVPNFIVNSAAFDGAAGVRNVSASAMNDAATKPTVRWSILVIGFLHYIFHFCLILQRILAA